MTASVRSASLCCFDPVRCWSRLPNASGATIRRSTAIPLWVSARAPALPDRLASAISGSSQNALASTAASVAVATRSRSRHVSAMRRALPAISTRSQAGCSRSAAASASAISSPFDRSSRAFGWPSAPAAMAASTPSSAFGPNPLSERICCASAAFLSASSESTPSSSNSLRARFGPSPGTRVTSTSPAGYLALSFVAAGITPSSSRAPIFSSIVLPTPASWVTRPARVSSSTDALASRIAFAALR